MDWNFLKQKNFRLNDPNLHPTVAQRAWEVVYEAWQKDIYVLITQAYRSIAEQNELYAQGRTKPGKIVTNAKGGTSYHNYGLAVDMALYTPDGKSVVWDTGTDFNKNQKKDWMEVVELFKAKGFKWGGDFKSFKDMPHFEMTFGFSIAQLKAGKRPARPSMTVQVPEPVKQVATIIDSKEPACNIVVNGRALDAKGFIRNDVSYLPVRALGNAAGVAVGFENGKATLGKGTLETTEVIGGTGYAQAREIAAVLGYLIEWDGKTRTVRLTKGKRE